MKDNHLILSSLVVSALLGVSQLAQGEARASFTPLEALTPEKRIVYMKQIEALSKEVQIDWATVIAGVDETGRVVLRARTDCNLPTVMDPTCFKME